MSAGKHRQYTQNRKIVRKKPTIAAHTYKHGLLRRALAQSALTTMYKNENSETKSKTIWKLTNIRLVWLVCIVYEHEHTIHAHEHTYTNIHIIAEHKYSVSYGLERKRARDTLPCAHYP